MLLRFELVVSTEGFVSARLLESKHLKNNCYYKS